MKIEVRAYEEKDLPDMITIWNEIVEEGNAFPQEQYNAASSHIHTVNILGGF